MKSAIIADVMLEDTAWGDEESLQALVQKCFDSVTAHKPEGLRAGVVAVMLTNDATIQQLNRDFLGKDKPTNVLSFPAAPSPEFPGQEPILGDIALAFGTCQREAEEKQIKFEHHLAHLVIHGLLHLFGYDHATNEQAEEMESLEISCLARLGISDPYAQTDPV